MTFAQRFGSALNLNPHAHSLLLDGLYLSSKYGDVPVFVPAPELKDEDVKALVETVAHRVIRLLERRGVLDGDETDRLADESPILAGVTAASVRGLIATGKRAGLPVRRVLSDPAAAVRTGYLCYASRGFSLHAATRVKAEDKDGLERLCRYVSRPPLAAGSLTQVSKELLSFKLKSPWSDGTTAILLSPLELIEKLSALVPPPRQNTVRYHGILAPNARDRDKIVPAGRASKDEDVAADKENTVSRAYRISWSALLARIFQIDLKCPYCGSKMKLVAAVTDPDSIRHYLEGTGQSAQIPELVPARASPQTEMDF